MREMPDASMDLIATDPPFNTNKNWGQFDDRWGGIDKYLKFMEERAVEMHRLLKDTGSLYLHCDPTASHYLKVMLDKVFGIKQFRNEVVWCYSNGGIPKRDFAKKHDVIFRYTKSDKFVFNLDSIRLRYSKSSLNRNIYSRKNGKIYDSHPLGKHPEDWWNDIPTENSMSKERTGYPTQKPVALYERIIKASSNRGDIVLDPFCGSGTTLDAAQRLGRRWIGIDQNPEAIELCEKRLHPPQHRMPLE